MTNVIEGKARKKWRCDHQGCRKPIALRQHQDHGQPVAKAATKPTAKKATKKKATKKKVVKKGGK